MMQQPIRAEVTSCSSDTPLCPFSSSVKVKEKHKTTSREQLRLAGERTVSKVSNQCDKHRKAAGEVRTYLGNI